MSLEAPTEGYLKRQGIFGFFFGDKKLPPEPCLTENEERCVYYDFGPRRENLLRRLSNFIEFVGSTIGPSIN